MNKRDPPHLKMQGKNSCPHGACLLEWKKTLVILFLSFLLSFFLSFFLSFSFLAAPTAYRSSQMRGGTHTRAATWATAVMTPEPYPLHTEELLEILIYLFIYSFVFLGSHPQHMEVPRLGVEWKLQLPAYTTAHSNAGSLTHRARPGIKSATSWFTDLFLLRHATPRR